MQTSIKSMSGYRWGCSQDGEAQREMQRARYLIMECCRLFAAPSYAPTMCASLLDARLRFAIEQRRDGRLNLAILGPGLARATSVRAVLHLVALLFDRFLRVCRYSAECCDSKVLASCTHDSAAGMTVRDIAAGEVEWRRHLRIGGWPAPAVHPAHSGWCRLV